MIQASIYGRLGKDPKESTTKAGNPMVTVSVAVDAGKAPGEETLWVSVIAFGQVAESLARHQQGDCIGVMGKLTKSHYQGQDGHERESWSIMADALHSSRTVRPGSTKRTGKPNTTRPQPDYDGGYPFNDPVPF
ncbi:MAG: single-stranded DNA-binding protein [Methylobacter sp.]